MNPAVVEAARGIAGVWTSGFFRTDGERGLGVGTGRGPVRGPEDRPPLSEVVVALGFERVAFQADFAGLP